MNDRLTTRTEHQDSTPRLSALLVAGFLVAVLFLVGFALLARKVLAGGLDEFDRTVLEWVALRRSDGLTRVMVQVTSLGGVGVLCLLFVGSVSYALAARRTGLALLFVLAFSGAVVLNFGAKELIGRPRPTEFFVPIVSETSSSFPSGHSLMSAAVYLTFGFILWGRARTRAARVVTIVFAVLLTLLVGSSRVYLGVHHPSDVVAGWMTGAAWALTCFCTFLALWRGRWARESDPLTLGRHPKCSTS